MEALSQGEWRPPSASPVCSLRRIVACLRPRYQMIWNDLQDLSSPWIISAAVHVHGQQWYHQGRCQPHQELFQSSGWESEGCNNPHYNNYTSVPVVKEKGLIKSKCVLQINHWLHSWCHTDIWLLYHSISFEDWGLQDRPCSYGQNLEGSSIRWRRKEIGALFLYFNILKLKIINNFQNSKDSSVS